MRVVRVSIGRTIEEKVRNALFFKDGCCLFRRWSFETFRQVLILEWSHLGKFDLWLRSSKCQDSSNASMPHASQSLATWNYSIEDWMYSIYPRHVYMNTK